MICVSGLATGVLILKLKRLPAWVWIIVWSVSTGLGVSVVYGVYHAHITPLSTPLGKLNTALARCAWSVSVSGVTLACLHGAGGPVNWILSLPPLRYQLWRISKTCRVPFIVRPVSRLTYCAYLIHPLIILAFYRNMEVAIHASLWSMAWFYVANLSLSYAAALILALFVEAPFINLQKIFGLWWNQNFNTLQ